MSPRVSGIRGAALLPSVHAPAIVNARAAELERVDALLAIVALPVAAGALRRLPDGARWRELDARSPARGGSVRTTTLSNRRQTLAVLGYIKSDASAFERLALAGRMLKEAAARNPQTIGIAAPGNGAAAAGALEALLAGPWHTPSRSRAIARRRATSTTFAASSSREPSASTPATRRRSRAAQTSRAG